MKRGGFLKRKSKIRMRGVNETSVLKEEIQNLLRKIVIKRDEKCILHGIKCYHEVGMEGVVWQAEHLVERSNSETYADSRLVVLICRNCHYWKHVKKSNHDQYNIWVKTKISKDRVRLWEDCEKRLLQNYRMGAYDWRLEIVNLKSELKELVP